MGNWAQQNKPLQFDRHKQARADGSVTDFRREQRGTEAEERRKEHSIQMAARKERLDGFEIKDVVRLPKGQIGRIVSKDYRRGEVMVRVGMQPFNFSVMAVEKVNQ